MIHQHCTFTAGLWQGTLNVEHRLGCMAALGWAMHTVQSPTKKKTFQERDSKEDLQACHTSLTLRLDLRQLAPQPHSRRQEAEQHHRHCHPGLNVE